jgi:alkanesulfonate monooxygenase SsuD/methylene tetrahydromethanopterin reductase-like flavin-dependent oxidoreductase (luciferase family)
VRIGIGIPKTVLATPGELFVPWARRAEEVGFSSLATLGRLVYPSFSELVSLAACAGATERITVFPNVLLAPLYDTPALAKDTGTLAAISGGRLRLGVGVGGRADDYAAVGRPLAERGRRFDEQLEYLHRAWAGEPLESGVSIVPTVPGGRVPIYLGGRPANIAERAVRYDAGWTIGGGGPQLAAAGVADFRRRWAELGGAGDPRIIALSYFSLGDQATEVSRHNLRAYYGSWLPEFADAIAEHQPRNPEAVREARSAFEDLGVEELVFVPTVPDLDQVDRLAAVAL